MKRRAAIIAGLASVGLVFGTSTAYADANHVFTTDASPAGGLATWRESDDRLMVCDEDNDGYNVRGWVYNPTTGATYMTVADVTADGRCVSVNRNISNWVANLKVCLYRSTGYVFCSHVGIPNR